MYINSKIHISILTSISNFIFSQTFIVVSNADTDSCLNTKQSNNCSDYCTTTKSIPLFLKMQHVITCKFNFWLLNEILLDLTIIKTFLLMFEFVICSICSSFFNFGKVLSLHNPVIQTNYWFYNDICTGKAINLPYQVLDQIVLSIVSDRCIFFLSFNLF